MASPVRLLPDFPLARAARGWPSNPLERPACALIPGGKLGAKLSFFASQFRGRNSIQNYTGKDFTINGTVGVDHVEKANSTALVYSSDYADLSSALNGPNPPTPTSGTIAFYTKITTTSSGEDFFGIACDGTDFIGFRNITGDMYARYRGGGSNYNAVLGNIPTGEWHLFAMSWDATTVYGYVDGVLVDSAAHSKDTVSCDNIYINGDLQNDNVTTNVQSVYFAAGWGVPLSEAEHAELFRAPFNSSLQPANDSPLLIGTAAETSQYFIPANTPLAKAARGWPTAPVEKPNPGTAEVNRNNAFGSMVADFWIFGDGPEIKSITGSGADFNASATNTGVTNQPSYTDEPSYEEDPLNLRSRSGMGYGATGFSNDVFENFRVRPNYGTEYTIFGVCIRAADDYHRAIAPTAAYGSGGYCMLDAGADIYHAAGGGPGGSASTNTIIATNAGDRGYGKFDYYCLTRKGTDVTVWWNGEKQGTGTTLNATSEFEPLGLGYGAIASKWFRGVAFWCGVLDKGFPNDDAVIEALLADPFQCLQPADQSPFLIGTAAAEATISQYFIPPGTPVHKALSGWPASPQEKPKVPVRINWQHSDAQGLHHCYAFTRDTYIGKDLTGRRDGTLVGDSIEHQQDWLNFSGDNSADRIDLGTVTATGDLLGVKAQELTIVGSFRWEDTSGNGFPRIIEKSNAAGGGVGGWGLFFTNSSNTFELFINGSGKASVSVTANVWHDFLVTFSPTSGYKLTVKNRNTGAEVSNSSSPTNVPTDTCSVAIGNWAHASDREMQGDIGYLYVFSDVREEQAKRIWDAPFAFLEPANQSPFLIGTAAAEATTSQYFIPAGTPIHKALSSWPAPEEKPTIPLRLKSDLQIASAWIDKSLRDFATPGLGGYTPDSDAEWQADSWSFPSSLDTIKSADNLVMSANQDWSMACQFRIDTLVGNQYIMSCQSRDILSVHIDSATRLEVNADARDGPTFPTNQWITLVVRSEGTGSTRWFLLGEEVAGWAPQDPVNGVLEWGDLAGLTNTRQLRGNLRFGVFRIGRWSDAKCRAIVKDPYGELFEPANQSPLLIGVSGGAEPGDIVPFNGIGSNGISAGTGQVGQLILGYVLTGTNGTSAGTGQIGTLTTGTSFIGIGSNGTSAGTGQGGTLARGAVVVGNTGTSAGTGNTGTQNVGHVLIGSNGTSAGTGQTGAEALGLVLTGSNGTATGTGQLGTLYTGNAFSAIGGTGTSVGTGQLGTLAKGHVLNGASGTSTGTGQIGSEALGLVLTGSNGTSAGTGQTGTIAGGVEANGQSGTSTGTGETGTEVRGNIFVGSTGTSAGVGQNGNLIAGDSFIGAGGTGTSVGTGQTGQLNRGNVLTGNFGTSAGTSQPGTEVRGNVLTGSFGTSAGTGSTGTEVRGNVFTGASGTSAGTGQPGDLTYNFAFVGGTGTSTGTGNTGTEVRGNIFTGASGTSIGTGLQGLFNAVAGTGLYFDKLILQSVEEDTLLTVVQNPTILQSLGDSIIVVESNDTVVLVQDDTTDVKFIYVAEQGPAGPAGGEEVPLAKQVDFIDDEHIYIGEADPGTPTSSALWRIKYVVIATDSDVAITWAQGNATFDKVWDDRLIYTYS